MIDLFLGFYDRYNLIILSLTELTSILLTIYFYIKYRRNSYQQLYFIYYAYGFLLNSICGFLFLIRYFLRPIFNNIGNNIIYYYKLPLIIGIVGFILLIIGARKERRK